LIDIGIPAEKKEDKKQNKKINKKYLARRSDLHEKRDTIDSQQVLIYT
jgi:hypothetical protein